MIYNCSCRRLLFNRIIRLAVQIDINRLKTKNPELSSQIDELVDFDPSRTNKYVIWGVKQLKSGTKLKDLLSAISYYHNNIQNFKKKDINQYSSISELLVDIKTVYDIKSNISIINEHIKSGAVKLFERLDDSGKPELRIYRIDNKFTAQALGRGTKWCITSQTEQHYENYTTNNVIFYYVFNYKLSQEDPNYKIAAAVIRDMYNNIEKIQWFDATDEQIDLDSVIINTNIPNIENFLMENAEKQPKNILAKIEDNTATEEEIDKVIKLSAELQESIDNNPNTTKEEKQSAKIYSENVLNINNKIINNKIIELAKGGNKEAIYKLEINFLENRQIIIELAKKGNEAAINKLDPKYPDMMPIIIKLLPSLIKSEYFIRNLNFYDPNQRHIIIEMMPKIIELAKQNEYFLTKLNPEYPEMRFLIIELAKEGNIEAITKLNSKYPDMIPIIIKLVKEGNDYAITKLDANNPEMRSLIIELVKQGNKLLINKLIPKYPEKIYPEIIPLIIELAKKSDDWTIGKLDIRYPEMRHLIIDLAKEGNEWGITQLNPIYSDMRPIIMQLAIQGNRTATYRLDPKYPEMVPIILELTEKGNAIAKFISHRINK